jgi:LysM repeat protein
MNIGVSNSTTGFSTNTIPTMGVANATSCSQTYAVLGGDYCSLIAQKNGISPKLLQSLNPTLNCNQIFPGQSVCVSLSAPPSCPPSFIYTVLPDEYCSSIATKSKISLSQLQQQNPDLDCRGLRSGNSLCVSPPGGVTCSNTYSVQPKEYCSEIAKGFHLTLSYFLSINPNLNCDTLVAGDVVCVTPPEQYCPTLSVPYKVSMNDTCASIASSQNVTLASLLSWNSELNCNSMYVGDIVCVGTGLRPTSTVASSIIYAETTSQSSTYLTTGFVPTAVIAPPTQKGRIDFIVPTSTMANTELPTSTKPAPILFSRARLTRSSVNVLFALSSVSLTLVCQFYVF